MMNLLNLYWVITKLSCMAHDNIFTQKEIMCIHIVHQLDNTYSLFYISLMSQTVLIL